MALSELLKSTLAMTGSGLRAATPLALAVTASFSCGEAESGDARSPDGEFGGETTNVAAIRAGDSVGTGDSVTSSTASEEDPSLRPPTQAQMPIFIQASSDEPVSRAEGALVDGEVCNSKSVPFQKLQPTVMLLVDRSTSMFGQGLNGFAQSPPFGQFPDRWEAVRSAVSSLEPLKDEVAFGLATYTGSQQTCPILQHLDVAPVIGEFDQVLAAIPPSAEAIPNHKGETPTAESLSATYDALRALPGDNPKFLMLLTDGQPELCANLDRGCGFDPSVAAVQQAFASGIGTFVIGLGEAVGNSGNAAEASKFLNDLAYAGAGLDVLTPTPVEVNCIVGESRERGMNIGHEAWQSGALANYSLNGAAYPEQRFFNPADADSLQNALQAITRSVRTCEYELDSEVNRSQANRGAVQLTLSNGTLLDLAFGEANGWVLAPDNDFTVVVQGTACGQILDADASGVKIEFPCDVRRPRVR